MVSTASLAEIASLVGDLARANMLASLMDGRALTAAELARLAGISAQTASGHLARLTQAGLLEMARQGRHRYHRLASPAVARMLEQIMAVAVEREGGPAGRGPKVVTGPRDQALRYARTCYDHLAGELAVAMADSMVEAGQVELSGEGGALTPAGAALLRELGVPFESPDTASTRRSAGRIFCRPCLDWSERRHHIAGTLGAALCRHCLDQGWLRRADGTRAVAVTPAGRRIFSQAFKLAV